MIIRRILASFLVLLFVLASLSNFFIYALSKTFLDKNFYQREDLQTGLYDFSIDKTTEILQENSEMLNGYFVKADLKKQIEQVFTKTIFAEIISDFATHLDEFKKHPEQNLTISLRLLRQSLLSVSNNLAYRIYQNLPTCLDTESIAQFMTNKTPSCVPKNLDYDDLVKPLTSNFETTIYNNIPEEMSNIDKVVPLDALFKIGEYRNLSFLFLISILVLIVLVIAGNTSITVAFIGAGFFLSGIFGYIISIGFNIILNAALITTSSPKVISTDDPRLKELLEFLLNFITDEVKRLSLLFLVTGIALFIIKFILRRTVDQKNKLL